MIINNTEVTLEIIDPTTIIYSFFNEEGQLLLERTADKPAALTPRCDLANSIKRVIDPKTEMDKESLKKTYLQVIHELQLEYDEISTQKLIEEMEEENKLRQDLELRKSEAETLLKDMDQPLIYIGSLLDWVTAGERLNTLLCFCSYCSQVLLNNPLSVIGLGESSSGKTFVMKTALRLVPDEFISYERMITPAAIFNRSRENPHFYEDKIVVYGDMGGEKDQESQSQSKDLMKELQTEGYLCKPISMIDENKNWSVGELELFGKPCLTYTTIPNYVFDDQELSRSIIFTPRTDNKKCFLLREKYLEFKGGVTYTQYKKYDSIVNKVHDIILHLRDVLQGYTIVNPYPNVIQEILSKSKYYKRDIPKYNILLKVITAINYYNNIKYTKQNGQKILFTSKKDIKLFLSLIDPYLDNIQSNISPKASEILKNIKKMLSEEGYYNGITTVDFQETSPELSKRSIQSYFKELNSAGLIKVVGKENRFNLYDVTYLGSINEGSFTDDVIDFIVNEFGEDVAELVLSEESDVELSVMDQDENIPKPPWGCGD